MIVFSMFLKGISPDLVTYSTLMKAFIRARKFDKVGACAPHLNSLWFHMIKECWIKFFQKLKALLFCTFFICMV